MRGKGESAEYSGIGITYLASDPNILQKAGKIVTTTELSEEYEFTDMDGSRPEERMIGYANSRFRSYWLNYLYTKSFYNSSNH